MAVARVSSTSTHNVTCCLNARPRAIPALVSTRQPVASYRRAILASQRLDSCRAAPEDAAAAAPPAADDEEEVVFYEGSGSNLELGLSLALGITLIYLPLTLASVGRKLWVRYRFTNKRLTVITASPVMQREVSVAYSQIKEVRTVARALGAWGDMVVFLKDGARLELTGLDNFAAVRNHIEQFITEE
jgi:hypothetical protein